MNWRSAKVLVTGGAGQIGSNLVCRLVELGATVTVADNLWRGKKSNLVVNGVPLINLDTEFLEVDLTQFENCLRACADQTVIFHLADVVAGINFVFGNQLFVFNTNTLIDSNMIRAATMSGDPTYVYVGTACSYPAEKQSVLNATAFKEEDVYPASPESSYGWSKLMGEYGCELLLKEQRLDVGVLRLHNVYGPRCEMDPQKSQVIPSLIRKAIRHPEEEFLVWGSGTQRRAFVFVDDVVDALISVVERGLNQGAIQIGPDHSTSILEVAERIAAISGKGMNIRCDSTMQEGDVDRCADWSKARAVLGWSPRTTLDDGLRKTYEWCERALAGAA